MYNNYIMNNMKPAIFLDRDGVIIENCANYVRSWNDVEIFPEAVQALSYYAASPYQIVFVTNQSAVGRGIVSLETIQAINHKLVDLLQKKGCRVDGVFICPHAPHENCPCRKPLPGLLYQASEALSIDLANSVMIGDAWTDLQAGNSAGVKRVGLVCTGRGHQQLKMAVPPSLSNAAIFDSLSDALNTLVAWP